MPKNNEHNAEYDDSDNNEYQASVKEHDPAVGDGKLRKITVIIALIISCIIVSYIVISGNDDTPDITSDEVNNLSIDNGEFSPPPAENIPSPIREDQISTDLLKKPTLPELPSLPSLPDIDNFREELQQQLQDKILGEDKNNNEALKVPEFPIKKKEKEKKLENEDIKYSEEEEEKEQDPRKTPIQAIQGSIPPGDSVGYQGAIIDLKGNAISKPINYNKEKAPEIKDLSRTISQGKLLTAILETAINTEIPGTIRGIVNRNVYAESGNNILIPKGTRLVGSYSTNIIRGQARVEVKWNKIIRPDGVNTSISLSASDKFGRSGIEGEVDNQYTSTIANALLTSVLAVGGSIAAQKLSGGDNQNSIVGSNGSVISSQNAASQVITQVSNAIIETVTGMISDSVNIKPVIRIPHGTKMIVIVNQDIELPPYVK